MAVKGLNIEEIDFEELNKIEKLEQNQIQHIKKYLINDLEATFSLYNENFIQDRIKNISVIDKKYIHYADYEIAKDYVKKWVNNSINLQEVNKKNTIFPIYTNYSQRN